MRIIMRILCLVLTLSFYTLAGASEDFTNAISAYLQHRGEFEKRAGCIVIGVVDEQGRSFVSYGNLDNGTSQTADENTVFGIHSETCIFTALLFEHMVERGELNPNDPATKHLTVKMP